MTRGTGLALLLAFGICGPLEAQGNSDIQAALAQTATTDRRVALTTLLERGATPHVRAVAGIRLAELLVLLAEPQAARQALTATDRSQLDRDDRRSFDRLKQLLKP